MPIREEPIKLNQIYHIYNRTQNKERIFENCYYANQFLDLISFYRSSKTPTKYSLYQSMDPFLKIHYDKQLIYRKYHYVEIYAYCLMPTHFHMLMKETIEGGLAYFVGQIVHSITNTYNLREERHGSIFTPGFKSKRVTDEKHLIHETEYIHLNPYSSFVTTTYEELLKYPYSSLQDYISPNRNNLSKTSDVLKLFNNNCQSYLQYIEQNADLQRSIHIAKNSI